MITQVLVICGVLIAITCWLSAPRKPRNEKETGTLNGACPNHIEGTDGMNVPGSIVINGGL